MQELKTCFNFQPSKQNFFKVLGIIRKLNLQQIQKGGMQEQGREEVKGQKGRKRAGMWWKGQKWRTKLYKKLVKIDVVLNALI